MRYLRYLVVSTCHLGTYEYLEWENPRQPYIELAVSLSAFCRMSYCILCSCDRFWSLSSALTARRDSTSFLISAGSTPGGASPEGSSGMKSSSEASCSAEGRLRLTVVKQMLYSCRFAVQLYCVTAH